MEEKNDFQVLRSIPIFENTFGDDLRPNGRAAGEFLKPKLCTDILTHAFSSTMIDLGGTRIVCAVNVKATSDVKPNFHAYISVEMSPASGRLLSVDNSRIYTEYLHTLIEDILRNLDEEKRHVFDEKTKAIVGSYQFFVDLVVLKDDGCILDVAVLCAIHALKNCVWPKLILDSEGEFTNSVQTLDLKEVEMLVYVSFIIVPRSDEENSCMRPEVIAQPSIRECYMWDVDGPASFILLNSKGQVLDMQFLNNFGCNLLSSLSNCHGDLQSDMVKIACKYLESAKKEWK
ncbi:hypothetical protein Ciccas_001304 [Cichlidogyrus casuarinus]|uniref:Ribosomal RNA-processing protein 42 n=1 Tax=Cichlidogyrus casuarinus TaxID=1844966 RepID=A0ABD2QKH2_9PLAT